MYLFDFSRSLCKVKLATYRPLQLVDQLWQKTTVRMLNICAENFINECARELMQQLIAHVLQQFLFFYVYFNALIFNKLFL